MSQIIHRTTFAALLALLAAFVLSLTGDVFGWWDLAHQPFLALCWLILSFALSLLNWATEARRPTDETAAALPGRADQTAVLGRSENQVH